MTASATITVSGSYGNLTVDRFSGAVLSYTDHDGDTEYADIVRFDVSEALAFWGPDWDRFDHWDILAVGFWTLAGDYVAAEPEWREMHKGEPE